MYGQVKRTGSKILLQKIMSEIWGIRLQLPTELAFFYGFKLSFHRYVTNEIK